eukprot:435579_1
MGNQNSSNSEYDNKVIFLDVDGVLNSLEFTPVQDITCTDDLYVIEEAKLKLLKQIVDKTKSNIVISSTWRNNQKQLAKLSNMLNKYGMHYMDCIPHLHDKHKNRTHEIEMFLHNHSNNETPISKWIAIDDMDLMRLNSNLMQNHFVHTTQQYGLTQDHANFAIKLLNSK